MKKLFLLVALCLSALSLSASVVYVAPDGTGDGTSWDSPLGNIQDAIVQAQQDETGQTDVWVKCGTYMLDSAIILRDSVNLYGGFAGTETTVDERTKNSNDPWDFTNLTIIDAQNNDFPCAKANKAYGYQQPLVVDGVVFQNGRALAANFDNGGGIRLNLNVTLQNSIVRNCYSDNAGGAVQMHLGGNMHGCLLENNRQEDGSNGGGAVNLNTSMSGVEAYITNCVFRGNSTNVRGGAINCQGNTDYYIDACTFYNNYAIDANGALANGGAIYDNGSQRSHITNCVFFNNSGKQSIYLRANEFCNNTLVKNVGNLYIAAGISTGKVCNNIVWNCYTAADEATPTGLTGSAIYGLTVLNNYTYTPVPDTNGWVLSTDPNVANCNVQFASNTTNGDFEMPEDSEVPEGKCLVGPHFAKVPTFSGAIPATVAEADKAEFLAELEAADFHIKRQSALLNAGTDSAFVDVDRDGNHRPIGRRTDVGAYEALTIANTAKDPYTIAEAIELTQAGVALTDSVYVIGVVDSLQYSAKYKNVNVWINDGFNHMEFYAMFGYHRYSIDSEEDLAALISVGDTLIAKGTLKYYANGEIYELYRGCYAIEVRKNVNITYHTVKLHGKRLDVSYEYIDNYGDIQSEYLGGWIEDIELSIRHGLNVNVYESTSGHCDEFLGWSDGVTENSRTITITSDTTIASEIYTQTYHAEITAGEGGRIYGDYWGDGDFIGDVPCDGYSFYTRAYANEGYYFVGWSDGNSNSSRNIHIYSDTTVTAIFKKYCTVTINGGAVSGEYSYLDNYGEWSTSSFNRTFHKTVYMREGQITVRENADCGKWLGWSDGVMDKERTIDVVGDTVIESSFDSEYYTIQIMPTKGGYIRNPYTEEEVYINNKIYACTNYSQDLRAYPYEGYYFKEWSNGVKNDEQYVYFDHNMALLAIFDTIVPATVTAAPADGCEEMGTVTGGGRYMTGDQVTVVATPKEGYHFVEWSDGYGRPEYTFTLSSDTTIYAIFAQGENMGKCGKDLYWSCEDSLLTITGTGEMDIYNYYTWKDTKVGVNKVSLPDGLTYLDGGEFYGQNIHIKELIIPATVTEMNGFDIWNGDDFEHLEYLGNSMVTNSKNDIGYAKYIRMPGEFFNSYHLIEDKYLDSIVISNGELELNYERYYQDYRENYGVAMPRYVDLANASNTTLENLHYIFTKQLRTLYLPSKLEIVSEEALKGCQYLSSVVIPTTVVEIAPNAFEDCRSMTSVTFAGNNVETIGDWAFYNCHSLRSLTLPEGVEEVGLAAFYGCTYLNELTIPSTMKKIADNGFAGCEKLGTMYVNALVPPTIEAKTFEDVNRATPVFVPKGTLERYQADEYWSEFFNMAEYEAPTGYLNTNADEANGMRKVVRNGQVLIIRGDKTYNMMGQELSK